MYPLAEFEISVPITLFYLPSDLHVQILDLDKASLVYDTEFVFELKDASFKKPSLFGARTQKVLKVPAVVTIFV